MIRILILSALLAVVLTITPANAPANAQDTRYANPLWGPPGNSGDRADTSSKAMIKELRALIDEAERARAADRRFLTDLKDLIARYERPWTQRIAFDDFADGNIDRNPAWTIASGKFWVEAGYGLRSVADTGAAGTTNRKLSDKELAAQVLGSILGQAIGGKDASGNGVTVTTATRAVPAAAQLMASIPPAFAIGARLTSWKAEGRYEIGVFQNRDGTGGYRVAYIPGQQARWELVKVTARGRAVIAAANATAMEDEKTHTIDWTRAVDGTQTLRVDGAEILRERDTSFRDSFAGLTLVNAGADLILRDVEVLGSAR